MYEFLNGEIIGKSHLKEGKVLLVTRSIENDEINIISFDKRGQAKVEGVFESFEENIACYVDSPILNETITFSNNILIDDSGDLVVIGRVLKQAEPIRESEELEYEFATAEEKLKAKEIKKKEN